MVAYDRPSQQPNTGAWRAASTCGRGRSTGLPVIGLRQIHLCVSRVGDRDRGAVVIEASTAGVTSKLSWHAPSAICHASRGRRVAYVGQRRISHQSLALTVGQQLGELLAVPGLTRREVEAAPSGITTQAAVPDPSAASHRYPHQFGGQQQRIRDRDGRAVIPELRIRDEQQGGGGGGGVPFPAGHCNCLMACTCQAWCLLFKGALLLLFRYF